jgi:hypothetical protein
MPGYLAETYTPQSSDVAAAAWRARLAAEQLTREGTPVRYVRSIFTREDEFCLYLFEADSADVVRRVGALAHIDFERVVEAIEAAGDHDTRGRNTMSQQTVTNGTAQRAVLEKLAGFRSGLEESGQRMLDSIVVRAFDAGGDGLAGPGSLVPADEHEIEALADSLSDFERELPADQRVLLGALLAKGSHDESEVEAHIYAAWSVSDWTWNFAAYNYACQGAGGVGVTAVPYWWNPSYSQFTCWRW